MMSEKEIKEIADSADFIVRGYAFSKCKEGVRVVHLNRPSQIMIMSIDGKMLETNMKPIEQGIVYKIWEEDSEFLKRGYA